MDGKKLLRCLLYTSEMPDADKANRQIIGDKVKAYEQGAMEERQENRSRAMQELGDKMCIRDRFQDEIAESFKRHMESYNL